MLHIKSITGILVVGCLSILAYRNRRRLIYRFKENYLRLRRGFGYNISLNDDFVDDLESGLNSLNFDIVSTNTNDQRHGLDSIAKKEIKEIMEREHLAFDKARLVYTERMFERNHIAPNGLPLDPKAVTFH